MKTRRKRKLLEISILKCLTKNFCFTGYTLSLKMLILTIGIFNERSHRTICEFRAEFRKKVRSAQGLFSITYARTCRGVQQATSPVERRVCVSSIVLLECGLHAAPHTPDLAYDRCGQFWLSVTLLACIWRADHLLA